MALRELWLLLRDTANAWIDDRAPSMGAALAFYALFSVAPLLIIAIAIAGVFFGEEAARGEIVAQIGGLIGQEGAASIQSIIESARNPASGTVAMTVGILTLIITASTVFAELKDSLDYIWRVNNPDSSSLRNFFQTRVRAVVMVIIIGVLLLLLLVASTALTLIADRAAMYQNIAYLIDTLNFIIFVGMTAMLFAIIYKILPDIKIAWKDVWMGAAITAVLFSLGKSLIALYLTKSHIGSAFGTAGSVIIGLLWVYYSAQIFFLGAEFTKLYAQRYGSQKPMTEAPHSAKTASSDA